MKRSSEILIYNDHSKITHFLNISDVSLYIPFEHNYNDLIVFSDKVDDIYYTQSDNDRHAEVTDIDNIVYRGKLINYDNTGVTLEISPNVETKIHKILSIKIMHDNGTVLKFSKPGNKIVSYIEKNIFHKLSYDIYVDRGIAYLLVRNIKITNNTNEVRDYNKASIIISKQENNNDILKNENIYRARSFASPVYNIETDQNTLVNDNNNSLLLTGNEDIDIINLSGKDFVTIGSSYDTNIVDKTEIQGQKYFVIDSNNTGEILQYGYLIIPIINIYPSQGRIIDYIDGKYIPVATLQLDRIQKNSLGKILVGKSSSVKASVEKYKSIENLSENEYKVNYEFYVEYKNFNDYEVVIFFEHIIDDINFSSIQTCGKITGNKIIWKDSIEKLSVIPIIYRLNYIVKIDKQNK